MLSSDLQLQIDSLASKWDLMGLARLFAEHLQLPRSSYSHPISVYEILPQLEAKKMIGFDGNGEMAFVTLKYDKETKRTLMLAMMYHCAAPCHVHWAGEETVGLYGELQEHTWASHQYSVDRTPEGYSRTLWTPGEVSIHQPFTGVLGLWLGLYHQPAGMTLLSRLTKDQIVAACRLSPASLPSRWDEMTDAEAQAFTAEKLCLKMPTAS